MSLNTKPKIFCVAGTRPEYIKLYPVYAKLSQEDQNVYWLKSGQHPDLLDDLEEFFEIKPSYVLKPKITTQSNLAERSAELLKVLSDLFESEKPDLVIVQGDTMTAVQAALAAYYLRIKVAHVEAGLRTSSIQSPFPEELFRRTISQISSLNFCPTQAAVDNLINEGHINNFLVGNTVIDALKYSFNKIKVKKTERPFVLVTAHRNENINAIKTDLNPALENLALEYKDLDFIIKVHENPKLIEVFDVLKTKNISNLKFIKTSSYPDFIKLMAESEFIITDSGGIQEEAPHLNKRVLVFRNETERQESIEAGFSRLIGTSQKAIFRAVEEELKKEKLPTGFNDELKIYGDANAATKIVDVLLSAEADSLSRDTFFFTSKP